MQSEADASRIIHLGAPADKVRNTGNMKLDISLENRVQSTEYRKRLSVPDSDILLVAGSTHKGEEEVLLEAYKNLRKEFANQELVVCVGAYSYHIDECFGQERFP